MQNERKVLVSAVLRLENDGYSNLILDSLLKNSELNGSQKAFVTAAFYGVVERKITIGFIKNRRGYLFFKFCILFIHHTSPK